MAERLPERRAIERAVRPSLEEFERRWLAPGRPVVLRGAASALEGSAAWSVEALRERAGATPVQVFLGRRLGGRRVAMSLAEAIDRIREPAGEEVAIRQLAVASLPPELVAGLVAPRYCPADRRILPSLWISTAGSVQPFHQDHHHPLDGIANLLVQRHGRKRALLVSPEHDEWMYRRAASARDGHFSEVDPERPDLAAHPLFRGVCIWEATLAPGETLFIPMRWWHSLRALDESVSLSFWWRPRRIADLTAAALAIGSVPGLRAFLAAHQRSIGLADVAEIGGVEALAAGLAALDAPVARVVSVLLGEEVVEALRSELATGPVTTPSGRGGSAGEPGRS